MRSLHIIASCDVDISRIDRKPVLSLLLHPACKEMQSHPSIIPEHDEDHPKRAMFSAFVFSIFFSAQKERRAQSHPISSMQ